MKKTTLGAVMVGCIVVGMFIDKAWNNEAEANISAAENGFGRFQLVKVLNNLPLGVGVPQTYL